MDSLLLAPAVMVGIGVLFGAVLAVADRFLRVVEDPRIDGTAALLPGTNCGACGQPGCRAFAERVVAGDKSPSQCTVSSQDAIESIAEYLQIDVGRQEKRIARLHCAGGRAAAHQIAEYEGFEGCRAAALVSGGGKGCAWGCLGLGDCERACTFGAIHMNDDGLPQVDPDRCTACPDCTEACPRDLFEVLPVSHRLLVQCAIPLAGEAASSLCRAACDACGKCALDLPGLIRMENNLPLLDYASGTAPRPEATFRCASRAIVWIEQGQFTAEPELVIGGKRLHA
jgi:Na+-translocating ferredoxin:NAD+ oxidoreductase RNF subunit RnfB